MNDSGKRKRPLSLPRFLQRPAKSPEPKPVPKQTARPQTTQQPAQPKQYKSIASMPPQDLKAAMAAAEKIPIIKPGDGPPQQNTPVGPRSRRAVAPNERPTLAGEVAARQSVSPQTIKPAVSRQPQKVERPQTQKQQSTSPPAQQPRPAAVQVNSQHVAALQRQRQQSQNQSRSR